MCPCIGKCICRWRQQRGNEFDNSNILRQIQDNLRRLEELDCRLRAALEELNKATCSETRKPRFILIKGGRS
jgi:hypothetical protein